MLGCYVGGKTAARGVPERFLTGIKTEKMNESEGSGVKPGEDQSAAGKENSKPSESDATAAATTDGEPMEIHKT
jgi:hypothetical protein